MADSVLASGGQSKVQAVIQQFPYTSHGINYSGVTLFLYAGHHFTETLTEAILLW